MHHLSADAFIDLLDETIADAAVPHLASCEACRSQLTQLRAISEVAVQAEVPEPSPLFWDHLAARVRESVLQEVQQPARVTDWIRSPGAEHVSWWRIGGLVTAAASVVALVVALQVPPVQAPDVTPVHATATPVTPTSVTPTPPSVTPPTSSTPRSVTSTSMTRASGTLASAAPIDTYTVYDQDDSLSFVADLAGSVDWDAAVEFALPSPGAADRSVADLSNGERAELERLLNEALAGAA